MSAIFSFLLVFANVVEDRRQDDSGSSAHRDTRQNAIFRQAIDGRARDLHTLCRLALSDGSRVGVSNCGQDYLTTRWLLILSITLLPMIILTCHFCLYLSFEENTMPSKGTIVRVTTFSNGNLNRVVKKRVI